MGAEVPEAARVRLLVDAYGHALRRYYGRGPDHPLRPKPGGALWRGLAEAAHALVDELLPPDLWARFRVDTLKNGSRAAAWAVRLPPLNLVYAPGVIRKLGEACRERSLDYFPPAPTRWTPEERAVYRRARPPVVPSDTPKPGGRSGLETMVEEIAAMTPEQLRELVS